VNLIDCLVFTVGDDDDDHQFRTGNHGSDHKRLLFPFGVNVASNYMAHDVKYSSSTCKQTVTHLKVSTRLLVVSACAGRDRSLLIQILIILAVYVATPGHRGCWRSVLPQTAMTLRECLVRNQVR
jgi:hypothetical protein